MKNLCRITAALAILSVGFVLPQAGHAEYCWMVGCAGRVGYVYLPAQFYKPSGDLSYSLVEHDCAGASKVSPFETQGLPDVNSVATLSNPGTLLLVEGNIEAHLSSFPQISITKTSGGDCEADLPPFDVPGDPMRAGAKVRILGYRTFISETNQTGQLLFALVLVVND
jgi:hypothetical protein